MSVLRPALLSALLGFASSAFAAPPEDTATDRLTPEVSSALATEDASHRAPPARPSTRPTRTAARPPSRPLARPASRPPPRPVSRPVTRPAPQASSRGYTVHTRPSRPVVVQRGPAYRPSYRVRPWSGVFVYGPRVGTHGYYRGQRQVDVQQDHLPNRVVNRAHTLGIGVRMGSLIGGYDVIGRGGYSDFGLGLVTRYRPSEATGLELSVSHYNQYFNGDSTRAHTSGQASGLLFMLPWSKLSPYLVGGITLTGMHIQDEVAGNAPVFINAEGLLFGPHGGAGLELALGESMALNFDVRYVHHVNVSPSMSADPGQVQTNAGLMVHF